MVLCGNLRLETGNNLCARERVIQCLIRRLTVVGYTSQVRVGLTISSPVDLPVLVLLGFPKFF